MRPTVQLSHLETNITIACQRRCDNCNHFVPLQVDRVKARQLSPDVVYRDLANFSRIARTDAWAAIGGEPLLHPHLEVVLEAAYRALDLRTTIEVWTNGQRLKGAHGRGQMPVGFYDWCWQALVVSVYPGVLDDADLQAISDRCREAGKTLHIKDERAYPNFTQLLVPRQDRHPSHSQAATHRDAVQIRYDRCWFKTYSRVLDDGVFYRCCTSPFIPELIQGRAKGDDGLRLTATTTAEELQRFLDQPLAMTSCESCAGRNTPEAVAAPWGETKDPADWLVKSGGGQ